MLVFKYKDLFLMSVLSLTPLTDIVYIKNYNAVSPSDWPGIGTSYSSYSKSVMKPQQRDRDHNLIQKLEIGSMNAAHRAIHVISPFVYSTVRRT